MNESEASKKLREDSNALKVSCFNLLKILNTATPEELTRVGYRGMTNAEAMRVAFQHYIEQYKKLEMDFLKQFPD